MPSRRAGKLLDATAYRKKRAGDRPWLPASPNDDVPLSPTYEVDEKIVSAYRQRLITNTRATREANVGKYYFGRQPESIFDSHFSGEWAYGLKLCFTCRRRSSPIYFITRKNSSQSYQQSQSCRIISQHYCSHRPHGWRRVIVMTLYGSR